VLVSSGMPSMPTAGVPKASPLMLDPRNRARGYRSSRRSSPHAFEVGLLSARSACVTYSRVPQLDPGQARRRGVEHALRR
jgi:hypothetical protein